MGYRILDNAYWEDGVDDKSMVKCIKMTDVQGKPQQKEVCLFHKILRDGNHCPQFAEVVRVVGEQKIDANTTERRTKKEKQLREHRAKQDQIKKTKELEHLFQLKLKAFFLCVLVLLTLWEEARFALNK